MILNSYINLFIINIIMDFWYWIGILLYLVQAIVIGYIIFWYLPKNITYDKHEDCPSSDESKFLNNLIDRCDITMSDESRKYLRWFFYGIGGIKVFIDLIILYLLTFNRGIKKPNHHTS
jgi:hypothetical protein